MSFGRMEVNDIEGEEKAEFKMRAIEDNERVLMTLSRGVTREEVDTQPTHALISSIFYTPLSTNKHLVLDHSSCPINAFSIQKHPIKL